MTVKQMKSIVMFVLIAVIFVAGCVSQPPKPITEISIPGQNIIYAFNNDVRESILVKSGSQSEIRNLFFTENELNIVFNCTDQADNGMFRAALIDFTTKVPVYLAYQGKSLKINSFYFMDEGNGTQWYNQTGDPVPEPSFSGIVLWLKGPATGATENSVILSNNTIIIQGLNRTGLSLASDKLTLIVFGIGSIDQINVTA